MSLEGCVECAAKDAELERLKAEHEEILLKHAREQNVVLRCLEAATKELERLKGLLKAVDVSVEKLAYSKRLHIRAIEALGCHNLDHLQDELIQELQEAAE
jgi:hypothetical protein